MERKPSEDIELSGGLVGLPPGISEKELIEFDRGLEGLEPLTDKYDPVSGKPLRIRSLKDGAEMVLIPAGEFIMGSKDYNNGKPQRRVYLDAYYIDVYPVTVAQYRRFCKETKREMPSSPSWGWIDNHPIVNVSWNDAKAYCDWAGKRLPTEAEWEKSARGTDGRKYPWENEWDARKCRCSRNNWGDAGSTSPVGSFPQGISPYGVYDMAGNVWEWCADWYDKGYYSISPKSNPTGPSSGQFRVLRGGSWFDGTPDSIRVSYRDRYDPMNMFDVVGFRCAGLK